MSSKTLGVCCVLWAGCEPLVATIGYQGDGSSVAADGADVSQADAASGQPGVDLTPDAEPGNTDADAPGPSVASDAEVGCVLLPPIVTGTAREGEIEGMDDDHLPCTEPKNPRAEAWTYVRSDAAPLLRGGGKYSLRWETTTGSGALSAYQTDGACAMQPLLPSYLVVVTGFVGCADIAVTRDAAALRFVGPVQGAYPEGVYLCSVSCSGF